MLPLAQTAALMHSLSHVQVTANNAEMQSVLHTDHCGICLGAQTVMGGAVLIGAIVSAAILSPAASPQLPIAHVDYIFAAHSYQSRAPPTILN